MQALGDKVRQLRKSMEEVKEEAAAMRGKVEALRRAGVPEQTVQVGPGSPAGEGAGADASTSSERAAA